MVGCHVDRARIMFSVLHGDAGYTRRTDLCIALITKQLRDWGVLEVGDMVQGCTLVQPVPIS